MAFSTQPSIAQVTEPAAPTEAPNTRRGEIDAARTDALNRLFAEIAATPVTAKLNAGQLLDRVGGRSALRQTLRQAEQIGGTRWLEEQTPQVRLEIDGQLVADALVGLARAHPHDLPPNLTPEGVEQKLSPWKLRSFAATGTSTGQRGAVRLRPDPTDRAWAGVSDADRRAAIAAARANAVARVLDSVASVETVTGKTIGEAMSLGSVDHAVHGWLESRPVTAVEFRDDLEVRLSLAVSGDDFFVIIADAIKQAGGVIAVPPDEAGWSRLHQQILERLAPAIGRGMVGGVATVSSRPVSLIPADPPVWVSDTLDAEAVAQSAGPLLRTARSAESVANERLRRRLDTLVLSTGLTMGEAAKQEPFISEALTQSMRRARVYKVDYNDPAPGSVRVRVTIRLEDVWRELNRR